MWWVRSSIRSSARRHATLIARQKSRSLVEIALKPERAPYAMKWVGLGQEFRQRWSVSLPFLAFC